MAGCATRAAASPASGDSAGRREDCAVQQRASPETPLTQARAAAEVAGHTATVKRR